MKKWKVDGSMSTKVNKEHEREEESVIENPTIARVVERMEGLPSDLQQLVLDFVQSLQMAAPHGAPGRTLLAFAGAIPADELARMRQAVTVACEQAQLNEW